MILAMLAPLVACAAVRQYPDDPEDTGANLQTYSIFFGADRIAAYSLASGEARTRIRDEIVLNRMLAYDITYSNFKRRLVVDGNSIGAGGDLISLVLTGLATTTGNAATKSALAAAATGILGAKAAISADLFYQRTLPVLIAQMDAARLKVKVALLDGLGRPDTVYPLGRALVDLDMLKDAGSIPQAVQGFAAAAAANQAEGERALVKVHGQAYKDTFLTRVAISNEIRALNDAQVLALMKAMDRSPSSDATVQVLISRLDPNNTREQNPATARTVLQTWATTEEPKDSSDAATAAARWQAALAEARRAR